MTVPSKVGRSNIAIVGTRLYFQRGGAWFSIEGREYGTGTGTPGKISYSGSRLFYVDAYGTRRYIVLEPSGVWKQNKPPRSIAIAPQNDYLWVVNQTHEVEKVVHADHSDSQHADHSDDIIVPHQDMPTVHSDFPAHDDTWHQNFSEHLDRPHVDHGDHTNVTDRRNFPHQDFSYYDDYPYSDIPHEDCPEFDHEDSSHQNHQDEYCHNDSIYVDWPHDDSPELISYGHNDQTLILDEDQHLDSYYQDEYISTHTDHVDTGRISVWNYYWDRLLAYTVHVDDYVEEVYFDRTYDYQYPHLDMPEERFYYSDHAHADIPHDDWPYIDYSDGFMYQDHGDYIDHQDYVDEPHQNHTDHGDYSDYHDVPPASREWGTDSWFHTVRPHGDTTEHGDAPHSDYIDHADRFGGDHQDSPRYEGPAEN